MSLRRAAPWIAAMLLASPVSGTPVYKWVNEDGTVTYSEEPPPEGSAAAEQLELQPGPSAEAVEAGRQREAELRDKADRMEAERDERESARQEARPQPQQQPAQVIDQGNRDGYYGYHRYPQRREAIRERLKDRPVTRPRPRPTPLPGR